MYSYTHTHTQAETTPPSVPHHDYGNIAGVVMEAPSLCECVCVSVGSTEQKARTTKHSHFALYSPLACVTVFCSLCAFCAVLPPCMCDCIL